MTLLLSLGLFFAPEINVSIENLLVGGLFVFGAVFAINSALHSYAIVAMAKEDGASMDVGFYYMANALGRLLGTILSGALYQFTNLVTWLVLSAFFAGLSALLIRRISIKA